ncbi:zinc finger, C2H2 type [Oesophagostomum dentatum]|uniref:Zinc finger, C2H2 type n=1 Tax=Oesophagostomum dentatum TaxID=61180 RepID=A0A0B1TF97_OESDE|nr:zinc finger, C2H2 type [Oesophagostomum dentatum]
MEALKKASEAGTESRYLKRKVFSCDRCEKCFSRGTDLAKHINVHESLKKWGCTMCEKRYSHKAGLDDHIKTVHKDPLRKMVTCKICSQQSNLNRHIRMQHPIGVTKPVLDCPECSCVFANNRTLTRHRREAHGSGG